MKLVVWTLMVMAVKRASIRNFSNIPGSILAKPAHWDMWYGMYSICLIHIHTCFCSVLEILKYLLFNFVNYEIWYEIFVNIALYCATCIALPRTPCFMRLILLSRFTITILIPYFIPIEKVK